MSTLINFASNGQVNRSHCPTLFLVACQSWHLFDFLARNLEPDWVKCIFLLINAAKANAQLFWYQNSQRDGKDVSPPTFFVSKLRLRIFPCDFNPICIVFDCRNYQPRCEPDDIHGSTCIGQFLTLSAKCSLNRVAKKKRCLILRLFRNTCRLHTCSEVMFVCASESKTRESLNGFAVFPCKVHPVTAEKADTT